MTAFSTADSDKNVNFVFLDACDGNLYILSFWPLKGQRFS